MSSTSPGSDPGATHLAGNDDSAEKYLDGMSGDAEGFEAETPQARQARAEALAHARAARAARARYARLVSQPAGMPNQNPHNKMQPESFADLMAAHDDRIARTEASVAATRIVDQIRSGFLDNFLENPRENAAAKAVVSGLVSYAPLVVLKPSRREGGSFVSDPRVWSVGAVALLALGETFKDRIADVFNINERDKSDGDRKITELSNRVRKIEEARHNPGTTRRKTSSR